MACTQVLAMALCALILIGCAAPEEPQIANPASAHCVDLGYDSVIRTNPDGSQTGYCILPDGTECEEWALYRGECP